MLKKTPKSDHFMDAESIKKTLNFTTTYPVLMRSATELYLNKIFQFAKSWGITHRVEQSMHKKLLKVK